jgi:ribonuclease PH
MSNESKWATLISGIVAAIVPLLVAYGVITADEGTLWEALAGAVVALIIAIVVPVTVTSLAKNYNDNDTAARVALMENETARLMAGRE